MTVQQDGAYAGKTLTATSKICSIRRCQAFTLIHVLYYTSIAASLHSSVDSDNLSNWFCKVLLL